MEEVRNINNKRICDISKDKKVIEICLKDCLTIITANPDGTLNITHQHKKDVA
ncbi:MAG: hypothetical protein PHI32_15430 [Dysgonamonadaceae bacterium]|jgi:hypothetical protein|uniref:hypothetical protein n=1 Tax=Haloimpatiens lingqiaonensis TaxID=1380675 RepID=UPI0014851D38|nr:hypothetical protein [Haloimpatiens lingqiaonensis]MDD2477289.1 hypothetical protein [Dysgonamonadaceae bacterium]